MGLRSLDGQQQGGCRDKQRRGSREADHGGTRKKGHASTGLGLSIDLRNGMDGRTARQKWGRSVGVLADPVKAGEPQRLPYLGCF